jgi:hypothetical protein
MKNDNYSGCYHKYLLAILLFTFYLQSSSQVPNFAQVPILRPGDSTNIVRLIEIGVKVQKKNIIAWFPKDSLSDNEMNKIVDMLVVGVEAAENFLRAPLPWQVHQKGTPYTYYFRLDSFVSHASGAGFVSIPFWRIKQGQAPWLHEAIHEMLNSRQGNWANTAIPREDRRENDPMWLAEGLPDYISIEVSKKLRLPLFDVFSNSYRTNIDSICREDLKGPKADRVISSIGKKGIMPELFSTDRRLYIGSFYHCSCSFVKYIAEVYGLEPLLTSLSSFRNEHEVLERKTFRTIEYMRDQWLYKINGR